MAVQAPRRLAGELLRRLSRPRPCARCLLSHARELRSFHSAPARCRASQSTGPEPAPKPSSYRAETGNGGSRRSTTATLTALGGGGILLSTGLFALSTPSAQDQEHHSRAPPPSSGNPKPTTTTTTTTDDRDPSLPRFRLADVRKHDARSEHPWVTHEDKVYDISDWVGAHPGGEVILRSAGGSIDPYWAIFKIHQQPYVREILAQYLIGLVDAADLGADGQPAAESIEDPFDADPARDARLITHTAKPRNAESPRQGLARDFLTPNELFYVRNHMWVPVVDAAAAGAAHTLTVELPDGESRVYTLDELRERFPMHRVTAVMQCSGNRRSDMDNVKKTNGLQWGAGAISNAEWEGVRLADVLADAGLKTRDSTLATVLKKEKPEANGGGCGEDVDVDDAPPDAGSLHVQFSGLEAYGASIPLPAALDPRGDVLLAMRMNGEPIPRDHGFPLRAVVPGYVAARSVKWLSKILVSDEESPSQWQRRDYKCFGPNVGASPDWDSAPAIQEMPVTSAITGVWVGECVRTSKVPWMGAAVQKLGLPAPPEETKGPDATTGPLLPEDGQAAVATEPLALQGYAYSGGGREIVRVDVSADGGRTWDQAELLDDSAAAAGNRAWAWKRWRYTGKLALPPPSPTTTPPLDGGESGSGSGGRPCAELVVKATDSAYNSQPEGHGGIYNVRGNLANAWHRVRVCPACTTVRSTGGGDDDDNDDKAGEKAKERAVWNTGDELYGCGFRKMPVPDEKPRPQQGTKA